MIQFFVYSNLFIALAASVLTLGSFVAVGWTENFWSYVLFVFFATLFDYNIHRVIKTKLNIGNAIKNQWAKRHIKSLSLLTMVAFAGTITTFAFIPVRVYPFLATAAVFTFLYSIPYDVLKIQKFDIRRFPLAKSILVALAWAMVTYTIPQNYIQMNGTVILGVGFWERFLFVLALTIPFDITDIDEDRLLNFRTLPLVIGKSRAWKLASTCIIVSIFLSLYDSNISTTIAILLAGTTTLFVLNSKKLRQKKLYNPFWVDGMILLHGFLLLVLTLK